MLGESDGGDCVSASPGPGESLEEEALSDDDDDDDKGSDLEKG